MDMTDNVATLLQKTSAGKEIAIRNRNMDPVGTVIAKEDIPFAHKISIADIKKGGFVIKFGVIIGRATSDINMGGYAHVHNVISIKGRESVDKGSAEK